MEETVNKIAELMETLPEESALKANLRIALAVHGLGFEISKAYYNHSLPFIEKLRQVLQDEVSKREGGTQ
jgi:hypothetical protein